MPPIGDCFNILQSVDSTNNYAMAAIHEGLAIHGNAYFAFEQTAGKGQRGRKWHTGTELNIALSIVLEPKAILISKQFMLSATIALACYDLVKKYTGDPISIKWPNDIYCNDRKAGGILIENVIAGTTWQFAVAGIGLNINQLLFDPDLPNPVSLAQITGKTYDVVALAKELCNCVDIRYRQLMSGQFSTLLTDYNTALYKRNETVRLRLTNAVFETTIRSVDENGSLLTSGRTDRGFAFGEVEWLIR